MGLHRTYRKRADRQEANETRDRNRVFKDKERLRKDAKMVKELQAKTLPYSPTVMSWLSRKLEKPSRKITPADVKTLLT
ncbi:MAG: hypothetical protein AABZ47_11185 [Planctomycetota bacterium]